MTTSNSTSSNQQKSIGETAVDGLLAGIGAGLVMALFLLLVGLLNGDSAAVVLGRFDPGQNHLWLTGFIIHLAVSSIYGILFGLLYLLLVRIRPPLVQFSWLLGLAYGLLLYAIAQTALSTGADSGLLQFTAVHLLIAHAVYGVVLGFQIGRKR
jgi:hypothetical protein